MAPLEVICAGMGRTGTRSLCTALDILGYTTLHGKGLHCDESLDIEGFKDAIENREEADWDKLYKNYNAASDVPTWFWYKDLIKKYPDVKVILTVRDPESWYTSYKNLDSILNDPKNLIGYGRQLKVEELREAIFQHPTSPLYGSVNDKELRMAAYMKHNQDVIDFVPKERLLVMELGEGWKRLCEFLDKPIPNVLYPNLNNPKELQESVSRLAENFRKNFEPVKAVETK